jgi:hypothetical protein
MKLESSLFSGDKDPDANPESGVICIPKIGFRLVISSAVAALHPVSSQPFGSLCILAVPYDLFRSDKSVNRVPDSDPVSRALD